MRALGPSEGARVGSFIVSARTLQYAGWSIGLAVVVTFSSCALGLLLALLTGATDLPLRRTCSVLAVAPLAVPCYVGATVFIGAFSPGGILGWFTTGLGLKSGWFSGFWASAFVLTMFIYPLAYLPIRAGLAKADRSMIDAARMLGNSRFKAWSKCMLPQIRPSLSAGAVIVALYSLSEFGAVSMLRLNTFTRVIYLEYESAFDRTGAARSSLVLIVLIGITLFIGERMRGGRGIEQPGRAVRPCRWKLGPWRWIGFGVLMIVSAIALLLPLASLFAWWARAADPGSFLDLLVPALRNSVLLALAASIIAVLLAIPIGLLASRYPSRAARFIERVTHVGFGLPGIVVGLALVFVTLRLIPVAYQSWGVVIAGYVILFLAQASGPIRAGFDRAPVPLEEAARTLGAGWSRRLRHVTLPLLAPSMVSAFLLVFISTAKELPSTLLLAPAGSHTLATRIWQYTEEAMYAESAPPALILIAISTVLVAILLWREGILEKTR